MIRRLEIGLKDGLFDAEGSCICQKIKDYFKFDIETVKVVKVLTFDLTLNNAEFQLLQNEIFTNPVTEHSSFSPLKYDFDWAIWVGFRPGVRDTAGSVALEAISDYFSKSLSSSDAIYTSKIFLLNAPNMCKSEVETIAQELLANEVIQQWQIYSVDEFDSTDGIGFKTPRVLLEHISSFTTMDITTNDDLATLSTSRNLALNHQDIPVILNYFSRSEVLVDREKVGLSAPTDVELEAIAQARSDHCNHNTFGGKFFYYDIGTGESQIIDNLFKRCIQNPTLTIQKEKDWVVSVLWDNAGIARFDETHNYSITGETHNSPSNMEAYGGSLTGIVGIYRDIMGVGKGARLISGLYGFCVGPRDYAGTLLPKLHPKRLLDGIVEGVKDGGNKHGVPTSLGNLIHHPSYLGKCLVFVAALGIMEKEINGSPSDEKQTAPGDLIIMSGGRVGKDGIHGVTASSEVYSENTPAGHVQIGDPYTQKKMHDFLIEAKNENLITFITDNGGGGLSSSIGESARFSNGAFVELDKIPLKYEGLDVWEIWISESQERMTIAVHPSNLDRFMQLSKKHDVESTVIGTYTNSGKLHLVYKGTTCAYLDLSLFTEDFPQWQFEAHWVEPDVRGLFEPVLKEPKDFKKILSRILASPNVTSKEWIQRQYDHEVQGGSAIKYLNGRNRDIPNDAAVVRPLLDSQKGLAIAQALCPFYSSIDTYHMVGITIDEAVRRLLSVGGKFDEIGGVDNFCWPSIQYDRLKNPDGKYKAAQLVRANWALRDTCLAYGIPLLSGKDSMYIDGYLQGEFGEQQKVSGLPTMQFTATSIVSDVMNSLTLEPKASGDLVYILGMTYNELGSSEYYDLLGYTGINVPSVRHEDNKKLYRLLEKTILEGVLSSCHGIYRGGIGVHLALMCFGSSLGMCIDLEEIPSSYNLRNDQILFSESCGRFIVTIAPSKRQELEMILADVPFAMIGRITGDPYLQIVDKDGIFILDANIFELKNSWTA